MTLDSNWKPIGTLTQKILSDLRARMDAHDQAMKEHDEWMAAWQARQPKGFKAVRNREPAA